MPQFHLSLPLKPKPLTCPKVNGMLHFLAHRTDLRPNILGCNSNSPNLSLTTKFSPCNAIAFTSPSENDDSDIVKFNNPSKNQSPNEVAEGTSKGKSFWGAVSLIIGAAVGPGMLGLPSLTIKAGPFPSTIIILTAWLYVISSIIIVAELCFDAMEEDGVEEVSFTSLAIRTLGSGFGAIVALVYSSLCFAMLVACVAGIGSIFSPWLNNALVVHALFPLLVGILIVFFPFKTIDLANRLLCFLMIFSITGLVAIGVSVARNNIMGSFALASWKLSSILPIIPVAVLTLGFHVITPFICKVAGSTVDEARKAILIGGSVPLVMVLSWNLIVLGLVGTNSNNIGATSNDPIALLLSVNPSTLSAVQGFAFSAMATSLIGYVVSLPKQLLDTLEWVSGNFRACDEYGGGGVGLVTYSGGFSNGNSGEICFRGTSKDATKIGAKMRPNEETSDAIKVVVTLLVLALSVLIASFIPSAFSRALDFAGVYANCFLFGIIPPMMAYMQHSKKKIRSSIVPGGNGTLLLLFIISVILGIWH